jgi:hypothetical protein
MRQYKGGDITHQPTEGEQNDGEITPPCLRECERAHGVAWARRARTVEFDEKRLLLLARSVSFACRLSALRYDDRDVFAVATWQDR